MCNALDGHAVARCLELKESASARMKKKWWWWRSKELVKNKNKRVCP
jgi:hypothetical protein